MDEELAGGIGIVIVMAIIVFVGGWCGGRAYEASMYEDRVREIGLEDGTAKYVLNQKTGEVEFVWVGKKELSCDDLH